MPLPNIGLSAMLKALSSDAAPAHAPEPEMPPLDFSLLHDLPRDPDPAATRESRPTRPVVYPPVVPFNYPNV
ncbi:MAG TPA: hypothetical protein VGD78_03465 [Chthoniobacterales bacterium]